MGSLGGQRSGSGPDLSSSPADSAISRGCGPATSGVGRQLRTLGPGRGRWCRPVPQRGRHGRSPPRPARPCVPRPTAGSWCAPRPRRTPVPCQPAIHLPVPLRREAPSRTTTVRPRPTERARCVRHRTGHGTRTGLVHPRLLGGTGPRWRRHSDGSCLLLLQPEPAGASCDGTRGHGDRVAYPHDSAASGQATGTSRTLRRRQGTGHGLPTAPGCFPTPRVRRRPSPLQVAADREDHGHRQEQSSNACSNRHYATRYPRQDVNPLPGGRSPRLVRTRSEGSSAAGPSGRLRSPAHPSAAADIGSVTEGTINP